MLKIRISRSFLTRLRRGFFERMFLEKIGCDLRFYCLASEKKKTFLKRLMLFNVSLTFSISQLNFFQRQRNYPSNTTRLASITTGERGYFQWLPPETTDVALLEEPVGLYGFVWVCMGCSF